MTTVASGTLHAQLQGCSFVIAQSLANFRRSFIQRSACPGPHHLRAVAGPGQSSAKKADHYSTFLRLDSLIGCKRNVVEVRDFGVNLSPHVHASISTQATAMRSSGLAYPTVRRDDTVVDEYHGTQISDPYRWLEDPDSEETQAFVAAQNKLTQSVLETCDSREKFQERMTELYNYPRYGCPFRYGDGIFYFYNTGLQPQSVLYMQRSLDSEPEVLLDPNTLSEDGTVSLSSYAFSENGQLLAYGLSTSGSDWQTVKVMSLRWLPDNTGFKEELEDTLKWVKHTSLAWTHDHKGFFYNRFPEPAKGDEIDAGTETDINLNQQLYYHWLGTDQSKDLLCWEDSEHPKWMTGAEVSDDGKYLILSISEGCDPVNRLFYCDLESLEGGLEARQGKKGEEALLPWVKLVDNFEAQYSYITNDSTVFTFHTNKSAPKYKLERVNLDIPEEWQDVISEGEDVLEWVRCVNQNLLLVCYTRDVKNVLQLHSLSTGSLVESLPLDIGSVSSSSGRRQDSEIFYSFTSFLNPGTIYRCDLSQDKPTPLVFREIAVKGFDATLFESKQVFVPSKDGTKVPMFIVAKKGAPLDGSKPALLYGYGGFSISIKPSFSVARVLLMRHYGAVVAIANIRGGNEYGEEWHKAGSLGSKQNCFDDFQGCAEYLISEGYTSASKLCIEGGSNGGLLVAACINQRPDLFGCAIAHVGVMDMLRFHKFTIGHAWTTDYGCSDHPDQFQWLVRYSPLHNIQRPWDTAPGGSAGGVQYPATMVLTGDHDDRVVPLHSLKYIATLQHVLFHSLGGPSPQTNPIIARIETKSGHGAGRPTKKVIEQVADVYSFMAKVTNSSWED